MNERKKLPIWLKIILFLIPLIWSEYMFSVVGRWTSMILFPIAWFGFWISLDMISRKK
ncbi:MAG: hypothetical protein J7J43_04375 [Thermosipho sp. (in: Bacteria)]|nr:hypothetical protein [Thermosipho sp. (in: thermotogales)]